MGTDDALDDDSAAIDEEAFRHSSRLVRLLNGGASILEHIECQLQILREGAHIFGAALVDADRCDLEASGSEISVNPFHGRHLDPTRNAPGGPDVHERHRALIVLA